MYKLRWLPDENKIHGTAALKARDHESGSLPALRKPEVL
jgi:hypothetical protein